MAFCKVHQLTRLFVELNMAKGDLCWISTKLPSSIPVTKASGNADYALHCNIHLLLRLQKVKSEGKLVPPQRVTSRTLHNLRKHSRLLSCSKVGLHLNGSSDLGGKFRGFRTSSQRLSGCVIHRRWAHTKSTLLSKTCGTRNARPVGH